MHIEHLLHYSSTDLFHDPVTQAFLEENASGHAPEAKDFSCYARLDTVCMGTLSQAQD